MLIDKNVFIDHFAHQAFDCAGMASEFTYMFRN
jgi:hypothetical protein